MDAEREGQRMLAEADELARAHLEETRARLDAYAADRIQRIHTATERLLAAAEGLAERFEEALAARRSLADLMTALGERRRGRGRRGARPAAARAAPAARAPGRCPRPREPGR